MSSTTDQQPYGVHEEVHNRVQNALDELDVVLSTPVHIPPAGQNPGSTLAFDREKASSLIKEIATKIVEIDLKHRGETQGHGVRVSSSATGKYNVYNWETVHAAQDVCDSTTWGFIEESYFEYKAHPNGDPPRHWVSNRVSMLLTRARRDLERSPELQQLREEETRRRADYKSHLANMSLPAPPSLEAPAPAAPPLGRVTVQPPRKESVSDRLRGLFSR